PNVSRGLSRSLLLLLGLSLEAGVARPVAAVALIGHALLGLLPVGIGRNVAGVAGAEAAVALIGHADVRLGGLGKLDQLRVAGIPAPSSATTGAGNATAISSQAAGQFPKTPSSPGKTTRGLGSTLTWISVHP